MGFDQQVAHLGCLSPQLDIVIAAAFERQPVTRGGCVHAGDVSAFLQQRLRKRELLRPSLILRVGQTHRRREHAFRPHPDIQISQTRKVLQQQPG